MGIGEIVNRISDARRQRIDNIKRKSLTDELRQYCENKNYGFYPAIAEELPEFSGIVEAYVRGKSKEDLPAMQFARQKKLDKATLLDFLEVGGLLQIRENPTSESRQYRLEELAYNAPVYSNNTILDNPITGVYSLDPEAEKIVREEDHVISWHTKPYGVGELTKGDLDSINTMQERYGDLPIYHVIYMPGQDAPFWYRFEKLASEDKSNGKDEEIADFIYRSNGFM